MDPTPVIFDLSSDDEPYCDDDNWLSDLLNAVDKMSEDSDEVVVVGEVNPRQKSKYSKSMDKDDDDDCVLLDGDPDNPVSVVDDSAGGFDEVLIVGEKGQIACRDYPHPRHLCAKFPFNSSPHETHCSLCHCYVCDSLAPCVKWDSGMLDFNHCHATDKEEKWKIQRKCFMQGKNDLPPVSKVPEASLSIALPQPNQVSELGQTPQINQVKQVNQAPPLNIIRLAPNPIQQNQVSKMSAVRACSSSTTFGVPNIISQVRGRQSGSVPPKNSSTTFGVPNVRSQVRGQQSGNVPPKTSSTTFGVPNVISQVRGWQPGNVPPKNRHHPHLVSQQLLGAHSNFVRRDRGLDIGNLGPRFASSRPMFKKAGSVGGALNVNRSGHGVSNSINHTHTSLSSQYLKHPPVASSNEKVPNRWQNVHPNKNFESDAYQSSSQPNMGTIIPDVVSSQPQVYVQPLSQTNNNQNINQCANPTQDAPSFSDFDFRWDSGTNQSTQHHEVDICEFQSAETMNEPSAVKEFSPQVPGIMNPSSLGEFENWLVETQPVPGVSETAVPPEMNILSPEAAPLDLGFLFDFETTWNGLTQGADGKSVGSIGQRNSGDVQFFSNRGV